MAIRYAAGVSTGTAFEVFESRTVDVTAELLSVVNGFENDLITYTATVLDNTLAKLPAAFVATLKLNGTDLVLDQAFDAGVYDQGTGALSLDFNVPSVGDAAYTVTLEWAEQTI